MTKPLSLEANGEPPLDETTIRRLAAIDLNLLVVFAALMREGSVTRAAERLFLGQPAISAALKRLRDLFQDPLFVKSGRGIVPTSRATLLAPQVYAVLGKLDGITRPQATFDPFSAECTLRLGLSDDNEIVFLPEIVRRLAVAAPGIRLVARPVSHADIQTALDSDEVDVGVSVFNALSTWHQHLVLYEQGYGCLYDPQSIGCCAPLSLEEYLAHRQAIVTFDGSLQGKIDRALAGHQLTRTVQFGTTRFATLPHLVKGTDLIASLPELVGRVLAITHNLAYSPLPFEVAPGQPQMAWHRRYDEDPVNKWFRGLVRDAVHSVVSELTSKPQ